MSQADSRKTLAFAALLLGAAAIAFAPIFVRLADTGPTASAFWRVALAAAAMYGRRAFPSSGRRVGPRGTGVGARAHHRG